jgi:hypothetical protein
MFYTAQIVARNGKPTRNIVDLSFDADHHQRTLAVS